VSQLESSGARVVPLIYHGDMETELAKLPHLNGVLFAGGAGGGGYLNFGKKIFDWAKEQNDQGNFFPLWGTCLGFQDLIKFVETDMKHIGNYTNRFYPENVEFLVEPKTSALWSYFEDWEIDAIKTKKISYLEHGKGFGPDDFKNDTKLGQFYRPTTVM